MFFLWASIALTACKSAADVNVEQLDTSLSWMATIRMVALSWTANRVPSRYAEHVVDEARHALEHARNPRAARIADAIGATIHRGNRRALTEPLEDLEQEREATRRRLEQARR